MGHQHGRGPGGPQRRAHLLADLAAQARVERGERLVEQHERGRGGQRAGQRDALLLPARQLPGPAVGQVGQPDQLQHLPDAPAAAPRPVQPEPDVAGHREVGEQRAVLRHQADAPPLGRLVDPVAGHEPVADADAARRQRVEARDAAQQRRLAPARGAQDRGERAVGHLQVDAVQHGGAGEAGVHPADRQRAHPRLREARSSSTVGTAATSTSTTA